MQFKVCLLLALVGLWAVEARLSSKLKREDAQEELNEDLKAVGEKAIDKTEKFEEEMEKIATDVLKTEGALHSKVHPIEKFVVCLLNHVEKIATRIFDKKGDDEKREHEDKDMDIWEIVGHVLGDCSLEFIPGRGGEGDKGEGHGSEGDKGEGHEGEGQGGEGRGGEGHAGEGVPKRSFNSKLGKRRVLALGDIAMKLLKRHLR